MKAAMKKVITFQAPNGETIDLQMKQIRKILKSGEWPRNESGEYCTISHGLHLVPVSGDEE
jgi:hypothetical protein